MMKQMYELAAGIYHDVSVHNKAVPFEMEYRVQYGAWHEYWAKCLTHYSIEPANPKRPKPPQ